jgi:hypothetical protein
VTGSRAGTLLYLVVMVVVVVGVDWRFLRGNTGRRLVVNACIVAAFLAVYWAFLRQP